MNRRTLNLLAAIVVGALGLFSMGTIEPPVTLALSQPQISPTALADTIAAKVYLPFITRHRRHRTATPSPTPNPSPTSTPQPGGTPTATPPPSGSLLPVDAEILGTCSAAVHDRYTVTGPDGNIYRTWHPVEVPIDAAQPNGAKCRFAHEHGQDPRTSLANPSLPPFGYIQANTPGHPVEPHQGFKVFVANAGTVNNEGRISIHSTRIVFHMGTGGVGRYTQPHHSLIFDMVAGDGSGRFVHLQGMADSGSVAGSICDSPRHGRTVMTTDCSEQSAYEIWESHLRIAGKVEAVVSTAVFDPITEMNRADLTQVRFLTGNHGCDAEAYHGPIYWYNANGPTVYMTDAFGTGSGPLRQEISRHATDFSKQPAYNATNDGLTQFKRRASQCTSGLGVKN
jgi:hypothetical protein